MASHANKMAEKLSKGIVKAGYTLVQPTQSNQIFVVLPNDVIKSLQEKFTFFVMSEIDDQRSMVRLVTSWATDEAMVDGFVRKVKRI